MWLGLDIRTKTKAMHEHVDMSVRHSFSFRVPSGGMHTIFFSRGVGHILLATIRHSRRDAHAYICPLNRACLSGEPHAPAAGLPRGLPQAGRHLPREYVRAVENTTTRGRSLPWSYLPPSCSFSLARTPLRKARACMSTVEVAPYTCLSHSHDTPFFLRVPLWCPQASGSSTRVRQPTSCAS